MIVLRERERERANSNDINTNIVICKRHFGKDKYFTFRWWFSCHMSNYHHIQQYFSSSFFEVDNISIRIFMHKNLTSRIFIVILCNTCLNCHLRGNKRLQSKIGRKSCNFIPENYNLPQQKQQLMTKVGLLNLPSIKRRQISSLEPFLFNFYIKARPLILQNILPLFLYHHS